MTEPASALELRPNLRLSATAGGAFHAVSRREDTPLRRLVLALLAERVSPVVTVSLLCQWLGNQDPQAALAALQRAEALGFVQGSVEAQQAPTLGVGQELHQLLPPLSSVGRGMIIDWNGLALATSGLDDDTAAALAALSADLIGVQERHAQRLAQHLGLASHGWAAVNAFGSSRIGAWPLYIGEARLMLVLLGEPRFNLPEFLALAWVLVNRYG